MFIIIMYSVLVLSAEGFQQFDSYSYEEHFSLSLNVLIILRLAKQAYGLL